MIAQNLMCMEICSAHFGKYISWGKCNIIIKKALPKTNLSTSLMIFFEKGFNLGDVQNSNATEAPGAAAAGRFVIVDALPAYGLRSHVGVRGSRVRGHPGLPATHPLLAALLILHLELALEATAPGLDPPRPPK